MIEAYIPTRRAHINDMAPGFEIDWQVENGSGMDAPSLMPAGGHRCWECLPGQFEADGFAGQRGEEWFIGEWQYASPMKTEDKTTEQKPTIGGKRPGSGRKALDKDGTIVITARLTGQQKATYEMLGGAKWLRHQLDLFAEGEC